MSSKTVKNNFFNESNIGPHSNDQFNLIWNPKDGSVQLIQEGNNKKIIFNNDTWDKNSITESGFPNSSVPDGLNKEQERIEFSTEIAEELIKAHKNNGGGVLPEWVKEYQNAKTDKEKNIAIKKAIEEKNLSKTSNKITEENQATSQIWSDIKKTDITLNTIKELMLDGPLKYPVDAIYHNRKTGYNQDHVRITQYTYKPPRPNLVGYGDGEEETQTAFQIATEGAKRYSPLEKYLGMVRLPMPTDISDSNNVAWGQDQINNVSAAITAAVGGNLGATAAFAGAGILAEGMGKLFGVDLKGLGGLGVAMGALQGAGIPKNIGGLEGMANMSPTLRSTLQSRLLAMAGQQVSPESILARGLGVVPNSNMELLFNAPALREFAFSWKMTPRDEYEAKKVRHIIRFFKQGMAARKMGSKGSSAGTQSLYLGTPNVFHVQYKTNRDEDIEGVNRIKTVACTGCSVNYTPDGVWSAYEEGQPVSTVMSLRMQELEPVYDTDYQGDITEGRKFRETPGSAGSKAGGDLYRISLDEVGY